MKIMLSITSLTGGKGGAERVAAELANEMTRRGHEVYIYSSSTPDEKPYYELDERVKHIQIPLHRSADVRQAIMDINPDVFFIFYFAMTLIEQFALVADTGIPIGAQECTSPIRAVNNFYRKRGVEDIHSAYAIRNAFLSGMHGIRFTMESYHDYLPAIAKPYCTAFNNTFTPAKQRAELNPTGQKKRIISVGGLKDKNKNGIALARAFAMIANDHPDWDVVFFGDNNISDIHNIIKTHGLQDRIILAGKNNNIYAEYESSQLHVICSYEEGCPNVVCEAMLHGIPSIGFSDCSGTNELIRHNKNGFLVDREGDEAANLAAALGILMRDHTLRQKLGDAAYDEALRRFDHTATYDRWEALLKQIAAYKSDPEKLFQQQCAIDPAMARRQRYLRSVFLQKHTAAYLANATGISNEKIDYIGETPATPPVSVIICTDLPDQNSLLQRTIESCQNTRADNMEIIVAAAGNKTQIQNIQETLNDVVLISGAHNIKPATLLNKAMRRATGEYILLLEAGDALSTTGLRDLLTIAEMNQSDITTGVALQKCGINPDHLPAAYLKHRTDFVHAPEVISGRSLDNMILRRDFLDLHKLSFASKSKFPREDLMLRALLVTNRLSVTPTILTSCIESANLSVRNSSNDDIHRTIGLVRQGLKQVRAHAHGKELQVLESHMIGYIVFPFVQRLLENLHQTRYQIEQGDIDQLIKFLAELKDVITIAAQIYPLQILALTAFVSGYEKMAREIIWNQKVDGLDALYDMNAIGLSASVIQEAMELAKIQKKTEPSKRAKYSQGLEKRLYDIYGALPGGMKRILRRSKLLRSLKEKYIH